MKVLFLISCFGHGRGGHFYSLRTIAEEAAKNLDISVVSIGLARSPVLEGFGDYRHISARLPSPIAILKLINIIRLCNIHVIHSFDPSAYLFARAASILTGKPVIHTKCGGPVPSKYYPLAGDLILFSTEDMSYFSASKRHKRVKLHYIPNRVIMIKQDWDAICELKNNLRPNAAIFLRIARFCRSHQNSIMVSINLINKLSNDGLDIQLVLVGALENENVYREIRNYAGKDVLFVVDRHYTVNASRLIGVSDFVIGTGRGAMEAAVQGKLLLTPVKKSPFPVLVDQENVSLFFDHNFSDRTPIMSDDNAIVERIKGIMSNNTARSELRDFIYNFAQKNFSISKVKDQYIRLYSNARKSRLDPLDFALHYYLTAKSFAIYSRSSARQGKVINARS
jgi:glycosyltransferase involved in cell wall biosynthesis